MADDDNKKKTVLLPRWIWVPVLLFGGLFFFLRFSIDGMNVVPRQLRLRSASSTADEGLLAPPPPLDSTPSDGATAKSDSSPSASKTSVSTVSVTTSAPAPTPPARPAVKKDPNRNLRIASLCPGPLDQAKMGDAKTVERLCEIIRRYDVIAIQDIRAMNETLLIRLVDHVNADGRAYAHACLEHAPSREMVPFSAFLFDAESVQIDPSTVCTVVDPDGRLTHQPLVAAFQAVRPPKEEAFTFTLVSVQLSPDSAAEERRLLESVLTAVRSDGRSEDDVVIVGSLYSDPRELADAIDSPHIVWTVTDRPTWILANAIADNILFDARATVEFTGRAEVADLINEFSLAPRDVARMTEHLPVWAEFSIYEGGP